MKTISYYTLRAKQARRNPGGMREIFCVTLALALMCPALSANPLRKATVKEQALSLSTGASVEVRLVDKSKLRGRLGQVTDEGFELQTVQAGKITTQTVAFDQVKSIRDSSKKSLGHIVGKAALTAAIGVGILFATVAIACAAGGCGS